MTARARDRLPRRRFLLQVGVLLAVAGAIGFVIDLANERTTFEETLLLRARAHFRDIVLTRRWNALHGGVYVEKRPGVEANPYLSNPDITTTDGKTYTLRNPALMTREISELAAHDDDYRFHITSLKLKNPHNVADDWERAALQGFAAGDKERFAILRQNGRSEFRYMAPLLVEQACLKCHDDMEYRLGDVRGGIAVRFDVTTLEERREQHAWIVGLAALLALAGVFVLTAGFANALSRRLLLLNRRHEELVQSIDGVVWEIDTATWCYTFVSAQAEKLLGFPPADWSPADFWSSRLHPEDRGEAIARRHGCARPDESIDFEYRFIAADGRVLWLRDVARAILVDPRSVALRGLTFDVTQQREQRERSNRLLAEQEMILNNVLEGIAYIKQRHILSCNRRLEQIFGYAPGELIGRSTECLYASREIYEAVGENVRRECGAGRSHAEEVPMRRKDGQIFWGRLNGQVLDPKTIEEGGIWIFSDIAERRAAEENARKLLRAVEQSPVSIVITDRAGAIEYVNPRFCLVTGYAVGEVIGRNPRILKGGQTPTETYAQMWATLLAGGEWRGVLCNRRKNGELFWEDVSISPIVDEQGATTHFIAVKEDITDRKRDEDALRRSHALLALTGQIGRIGGWSWDVATQTLSYTEEIFRNYGLPPGAPPTVAESLARFTPESRPLIEAAIRDALRNGTPWDVEVEMYTGSGETLGVRAQGLAERDPATGRVVRLYGALQDVTEQRRVKAELQEYQLHLEEVVERRTADLASALEAAKVADKVKDSFLANVSHELRTPLNGVIGLSALALEQCRDPRLRGYLEKVIDSGQTLLAIINDLLDLTKIAVGEMRFERKPFRVREIVARVLSTIGLRAADKGLRLDGQVDDSVPEILIGDPLRIEQILLNLLNNAIKFTAHGRVALHLALVQEQERCAEISIEVDDTGIGMSADELANIYQPFVQADPSITRKHGGTGLGLAICKQLAEGMSGGIEVHSQPERGTRFCVRLRLEIADEDEGPLGAAPAIQDLPRRYHNARVLVVDDQAINREIVSELLDKVGIQPRLAENGREALDILRAGQAGDCDLVLMDIQMPVMDGLTASREIRALPGRAALPIVAMTAHTMVHEKETYLGEGWMNDHIGKPFSLADFYSLIAKWLAHRVAVPVASAPASAAPTGDDELAPVGGLLVAEGIERFGGNRLRYRHWLEQFIDESADFAARLDELLRNGADEAARRATHAFKGRVGMLAMPELHHLAGAVEQSIRDGQTSDELRQQLAEAVERMRLGLRRALGSAREAAGTVAAPPVAALPDTPLPRAIVELCRMLDEADGGSATAIAACLTDPSCRAWVPLLHSARTLVERFDFDAARRLFFDRLAANIPDEHA